MKSRLPLAVTALALLGLAACVPEQGQGVRPVTQAANAPTAAAVNASVQRALAEAAKAVVAAQQAEAAARRGQEMAARAGTAHNVRADHVSDVAAPRGEPVYGVISYSDGSRYEGQLVGLTRHGLGVFLTAQGARYAGEWVNGRMLGHGSLTTTASSARYDGEWLNAQRHGLGVQIDANGERYAGEFREGRPLGLGALFDAQGKPKAAGTWGQSNPAAVAAATPQPEGPSRPARASYGTGFLVSARGAILTNEHVVRGCTRIEVREEDGSFTQASLVRTDARVDLALLDLARPTPAFAMLRESGTLREGEEIVVYGFPFAAQVSPGGTVTSGIVSSLFGLRGAAHQLQITAPVQTGNSGGPVLDRQGRVVAIVQSKLNALSVARATGDLPQNVNFAVKSTQALELMRGAGMTPTQAPAQAGEKRIVDIVETAKRWTVLVRCQR